MIVTKFKRAIYYLPQILFVFAPILIQIKMTIKIMKFFIFSFLGKILFLRKKRTTMSAEVKSNVKKSMTLKKFNELEKKASNGDPEAQLNISFIYKDGDENLGVEKDIISALYWCQKSAKQGYITAMANLAITYEYGIGIKQNCHEAINYYLKCAEKGDAEAQYKIWCLSHDGYYLETKKLPSSKICFTYLKKSAKQGHKQAQLSLADHYRADNIRDAIYWYKRYNQQVVVKGSRINIKKVFSGTKKLTIVQHFQLSEENAWLKMRYVATPILTKHLNYVIPLVDIIFEYLKDFELDS